MLASGLVLILLETALFLAFHERRALDGMQARALRDGERLVRLQRKIPTTTFLEELDAVRMESDVKRIDISVGKPEGGPNLRRDESARELIAQFDLSPTADQSSGSPNRRLTIRFDLADPMDEAKETAKTQAIATAGVLGIGSILLWIVLDSTIAKRAGYIMANARALTDGEPLGIEVGGEDELSQIDRALRDAHATIHQQAADLQARADLLAEKNEERSRLQQEIIQISEREQQRIGQDLHDDVCQRLAAVKMKIQDHEEKLAETAPLLLQDAGTIATDLAGAIHITRMLARGLSPVAIGSGGLDAALKGLARAAGDMFGITCEFVTDEQTPPLDHDTAHQLYRIAQECVANAAKHAKARLIHISLRSSAQGLVLRVRNDGSPMPPDAHPGDGMGMTIMRHRAASIGASIQFETEPPDGSTAVECVLRVHPISQIPQDTHNEQKYTQ